MGGEDRARVVRHEDRPPVRGCLRRECACKTGEASLGGTAVGRRTRKARCGQGRDDIEVAHGVGEGRLAAVANLNPGADRQCEQERRKQAGNGNAQPRLEAFELMACRD
jgi:hypothetical protein